MDVTIGAVPHSGMVSVQNIGADAANYKWVHGPSGDGGGGSQNDHGALFPKITPNLPRVVDLCRCSL